MNMITFAEPVTMNMRKSAGVSALEFEAGRDYVVPLPQFNRMMAEPGVAARAYKVSRIENRIPNFNVVARKQGTQRLLLYNGSGGYGDQIMTWPFARLLVGYGFEVHILTDPGNQTCWFNFPWVKTIQKLPIQYEHFKMYDYWVMFEAVVNADEHQHQCHPLDVMCMKVGIDPAAIDQRMMVVRPNFTFLEMQSTAIFQGKKIAMYQLASANPIRCLPPNDSAFLLFKLAEAFPEWHWLALYDEFIPDTYKNAVACKACEGKGRLEVVDQAALDMPMTGTIQGTVDPNVQVALAICDRAEKAKHNEICTKCNGSGTLRSNIQLYNAPVLRELWALTSRAQVVVAPDSMMVHTAGCMDVPCVGLWGLVNPENRVKYYKNHVPIYHKESCVFSPCFAYSGTFPKYCPPRPNRNVCECLGAIAAPEVVEAVKKAIPATPQPPA